jgi:UDP-N-acetyl-2-amino-2-deoxyglucuronate dehydrogenase
MKGSEGEPMKKFKFALIGCGRISGKHCEALAELPDAELAAVCDIKPELAKATGEKWKVPFFSGYEEMLSAVDVDAVNILTPSGLHAEHAIGVAKKFKKHIVCEKPMALTIPDADAMIDACSQTGVKLFVVKQNRFNLPVMKLREALEQGRFGKLVLGTVRVRWARDQRYYDQASWRGTWALDGGVFTNQASHHLDLLEWMMGEVAEVSAVTATQLVKIEAEDTGLAILKFKNGALGVIEATTAARPKNIEGSLSVLGDSGTVEIGGFAVNELKLWQFREPRPDDAEVMTSFRENPPNVYGFGHSRYLQHVVDCLQGKAEPLVDGREGRKSLELITALYEAAETGRRVKIGEPVPHCRLGRKNG